MIKQKGHFYINNGDKLMYNRKKRSIYKYTVDMWHKSHSSCRVKHIFLPVAGKGNFQTIGKHRCTDNRKKQRTYRNNIMKTVTPGT